MELLQLVAYGLPAPQGSKRHVGGGVMIESSKYVKPWREAVKSAALDARIDRWTVLDEPVVVDMVFAFLRPKGHWRTGRNAHLLKDNAPVRPAGKPDVSKLCRSTEDALTDAGIWRDDALVVEYGRLAKVWVREDPDALDIPGVRIRIRQLVNVAQAVTA